MTQPITRAEKPDSVTQGGSGGCLLLWAYLMFLSLVLSPVIAQVVKDYIAPAEEPSDAK